MTVVIPSFPSLSLPSLSLPGYRERVMGCWLGKAIGGTLGMPFEGNPGPLDLSFYTPVPTEMLPNDDLDLQVVWACVLDKMERPRVDRHVLAQAWLDHVQFPWDEYGVALRNLKNGLKAPLSGSYDNWFTDSMGAPIRSEIWACLAPGDPALAAAYAYEDGCVDHGGEGLWAEVFLAALQSAAFTESDPEVLLQGALGQLPETSRTRLAVEDTVQWWQEGGDWKEVRQKIVAKHGRDNFTDAPMNIAFTVLGWLAGDGDFSRTICIAVNCGMDTDCTGATVGGLMGILDPDGIPQRWIEPIGRSLVLSPDIVGLEAPSTLDGFTDLVLNLRDRLEGRAADAGLADELPQSVAGFQIGVEREFAEEMPAADAPPQFASAVPVALPGTVGRLAAAEFAGNVLLLRYTFHLSSARTVRVMFNTPQECRVWVDGAFAFERGGGVMAPSFHRVPKDQSVDLALSAGQHTLSAAVRRPETGSTAEWVAGVADKPTMQWIPEGFSTAAE